MVLTIATSVFSINKIHILKYTNEDSYSVEKFHGHDEETFYFEHLKSFIDFNEAKKFAILFNSNVINQQCKNPVVQIKERLGLTYDDIGKAIHTSRQNIQCLCTSKHLRYNSVKKIADVFGIDMLDYSSYFGQ